MKVLFITRKWPPAIGGMETYSVRLSEELAGKTELTKIVLPGRKEGSTPTALSIMWFGVKTAVQVLREANRFDIVHGADMAIWPLMWLAQLRAPHTQTVLSAHGSDVAFANRRGVFPFLYRCYLWCGARLLADAFVIANSRATAGRLRRRGFACATVIPLAADMPSPKPGIVSRNLLFVGRLTQQKGCRWFVDHVLPQLPPDITLQIAGAVIDESERTALNSPRINYLGPVTGDRLTTLRQKALAVIVPNIHVDGASFEGFGLTAVEASAAGGVVVASDFYGLADAVIDGKTGFLAPPGDADAWRRTLEDIFDWTAERRRAFLETAGNETAAHFSWARVARQTLTVYESARAAHGVFTPVGEMGPGCVER